MKKIFSRLLVLFAFMFLVPFVYASELTENLTLEDDSTECYVVKTGSDITIDLNGHNITCTGADAIYVENNATLTMKGEGTVQSVTSGKAAIFNNGTVYLNGGTYSANVETTKYYTILNHGYMTIKNGVTVEQTGYVSTTASLIDNGYYDFTSANERLGFVEGKGERTPTLMINGGEFNGGMNTIKNDDNGVLDITGGHFVNNIQVAVMNWNIATISGGVFEVPTGLDKTTIFNGSYGADTEDKGILNINGGTFNGEYILEFQKNRVASANINIKGGTFASTVAFVNPKDSKGNDRPTWNDVGTKAITGGIFSDVNIVPSDGYSTVAINQDNDNNGVNDVLVTNVVLQPVTDVNLTIEETYDTQLDYQIIKYGTWTIADNTVVSVNNGVITGLKKGTTTVKVQFGSDVKTYKVVVSRIKVTKPTISGTYVYSGENQEVVLNDFNEELMTATNKVGLLVNKYTTTVALNNTVKYEWADGTDAALELEWNITKATVTAPTLAESDYTYTGSAITPTVNGYDENTMSVTGNLTAQEMGTYTITYTLVDPNNNAWANGEEEVVLTWNITRGKITKPTLNPASYSYTGKTITPTLKDFDETIMTLGGNTTGSPVGTYHLTVSLKDKTMYTWADNTTDDVELTWKIVFGVPELKATSTYNSVKLTWEEVEGATGYQVYRCNSKGASCTKLTTTDKLTYKDKKLTFNKTYYYKVRAYKTEDGVNSYSKYSALLGKKTALTAPTVTASKDRYRQVLIEWTKVAGATRYYVYRCNEEGKECKNIGFAYDTDLVNTNASEGVTYTYKVKAYRSGVYGPYSTLVEGERLVDTITMAVKNISYRTNKIAIKNVETATKYYIYRATSKNGTYTKIKTLDSTGEMLIYEDKDISFNKTYYYKVRITNGVNNSDFSAIKEVTTNKLAAPEDYTYYVDDDIVYFTFPTVNGATGYHIAYSQDGETYKTLDRTTDKNYEMDFENGVYVKLRAYRLVSGKYYYGYYTDPIYLSNEK